MYMPRVRQMSSSLAGWAPNPTSDSSSCLGLSSPYSRGGVPLKCSESCSLSYISLRILGFPMHSCLLPSPLPSLVFHCLLLNLILLFKNMRISKAQPIKTQQNTF